MSSNVDFIRDVNYYYLKSRYYFYQVDILNMLLRDCIPEILHSCLKDYYDVKRAVYYVNYVFYIPRFVILSRFIFTTIRVRGNGVRDKNLHNKKSIDKEDFRC